MTNVVVFDVIELINKRYIMPDYKVKLCTFTEKKQLTVPFKER